MSKLRVPVKELAVNAKYPGMELCIYDWDTCIILEQDQVSFDSEKGYADFRVVLQRKSDDKFFAFTYTQFGHNGDDILKQTAEEVFEKTKTITYYE